MDEIASIDALARLDRRRRLFPAGAACGCGVRNPIALVAARAQIVCYACEARRRRHTAWEEHHLGGRPSPFVVPVPTNQHRILSFLQEATWRRRYAPGSWQAIAADLVFLLLALVGRSGRFDDG